MNDFTKNMAQALFNQDKINDLLRKELDFIEIMRFIKIENFFIIG